MTFAETSLMKEGFFFISFLPIINVKSFNNYEILTVRFVYDIASSHMFMIMITVYTYYILLNNCIFVT